MLRQRRAWLLQTVMKLFFGASVGAGLLALVACAAGSDSDPAGSANTETNSATPGGSDHRTGEGSPATNETPTGGAFSSNGASSTDAAAHADAGSNVDASLPGPQGPTPWTSPCTGAITTDDILAHFAPAATSATFGTVWADARSRQCQDQTGCQPWQAASSVDLYRINYTGSGFTFVDPTTLSVPATGTITCTVPGPECTLTLGPMTSNVYPAEQGRPLGITPAVGGAQVQVGSWSSNPRGTYLQYTSSIVAKSCLWGSMSGRVYGASGTYVETELVVWGSY
jgi:hypothetical protein